MLATALLLAMLQDPDTPAAAERPRPRDLGLTIGTLPAGPLDAITDVAGVRVGHATVVDGDDVRTGVTVVVPHGDDPFRAKVPAAVVTRNGFGKLAGSTQVDELGELETPIALTNTLAVGDVVRALVDWTLAQPGNAAVASVNAVVAETNDGWLNAIRRRTVTADHVTAALARASGGPIAGGAVGAGAGTRCFGFKGGIGTASRRATVPGVAVPFTVGVLVQTNFGGALTIAGVPVGARLAARPAPTAAPEPDRHREDGDGSCVIVVATDAPLDARNLRRLAERTFAGMARTGASFSNGSGDYALAFSTATALRIPATDDGATVGAAVLRNDRVTPLFLAAAEATEAAIVDALFRAATVRGQAGRVAEGLPVDAVLESLTAAGVPIRR